MRFNLMGGEHELALPIGALEDIARTQPQLEKLYIRIVGGEWTLGEIRAVIDAAIKWSSAPGLTFAGLVDYEGLARVKMVAVELFEAAWLSHEDRKKLAAPEARAATGATENS
jgi:hypothetical protein